MFRFTCLVCSALVLAGCVGSRSDRLPPDTRFRAITATADLRGDFSNQGTSANREWHPLLSDVLFLPATLQEPPSAIRFSSPAPAVLRCEALVDARVVARRDFVEGRDFRLADGRLRLAGTLGESGIMEGGVGVSTEINRLGLTEQGDIVLTCTSSGAGLMLLVVPLAITAVEEARFERLPNPPRSP